MLKKYLMEFNGAHGSCLDWIFISLDDLETLGYSFDLIKVSWFINPYFDGETVLGREVGGWFGYDSTVIWGRDAKPIKKYKIIYLVCDKCREYYQLKPDESVDDFPATCKCGGHLECKMASEKIKIITWH